MAQILDAQPPALGALRKRFPALGCFADLEAAGLVTLAEAAHMAEVTAASLIAFLNGEVADLTRSPDALETVPDWLAAAEAGAEILDVRPLIGAGEDPRDRVLGLARQMPEGGYLAILAPFDPVPLRNLLARMGFASYARHEEPGRWRVIFRREAGPRPQIGLGDRGGASCGPMDLRGLEAPAPMVAILRRIDGEEGQGASFEVLLDRDPLFLHPELAERGWEAQLLEDAPAGLRFWLARIPAP